MPRLPLIFLVKFQLFDTNALTSINENIFFKKHNYSYPLSGQKSDLLVPQGFKVTGDTSLLGSHSWPLLLTN